jgi:hypothetical protein
VYKGQDPSLEVSPSSVRTSDLRRGLSFQTGLLWQTRGGVTITPVEERNALHRKTESERH